MRDVNLTKKKKFCLTKILLHFCIIFVFLWLSGRALRQQRKGCGFDSQGTHILTKKFIS